MRVHEFRIPTLTLGWGAIDGLRDVIRKFGRRVLLVTDPGVRGQPFFTETVTSLENAGIEVVVFAEVAADPPVSVFESAAHEARRVAPSCVAGIGGGSALDVAKIAAVLAEHSCPLGSLVGIDRVPARGIPTVLIPTTAGTGSEVTPIAVVSDEAEQLKKGIVSEHLIADHAIVDPQLCVSLPPWPTAYTGMDALTHAIEAYTNQFAVPLIDMHALEAIRLIAAHLPRACRDGGDREARDAMSRGSLLAGMCLGPVNTAAVHAMAYPLGGRFKVPHGIANSLLLPHVVRFNTPAARDRYLTIADAMQDPDRDPVAAIERLSASVGTDKKMRDFGVTEAHLPSMAADALKVTRLMRNNPRAMTEEQAWEIYRDAW